MTFRRPLFWQSTHGCGGHPFAAGGGGAAFAGGGVGLFRIAGGSQNFVGDGRQSGGAPGQRTDLRSSGALAGGGGAGPAVPEEPEVSRSEVGGCDDEEVDVGEFSGVSILPECNLF